MKCFPVKGNRFLVFSLDRLLNEINKALDTEDEQKKTEWITLSKTSSWFKYLIAILVVVRLCWIRQVK